MYGIQYCLQKYNLPSVNHRWFKRNKCPFIWKTKSLKAKFQTKSPKKYNYFQQFIQSYAIKLVLVGTSFFMSSLNFA